MKATEIISNLLILVMLALALFYVFDNRNFFEKVAEKQEKIMQNQNALELKCENIAKQNEILIKLNSNLNKQNVELKKKIHKAGVDSYEK